MFLLRNASKAGRQLNVRLWREQSVDPERPRRSSLARAHRCRGVDRLRDPRLPRAGLAGADADDVPGLRAYARGSAALLGSSPRRLEPHAHGAAQRDAPRAGRAGARRTADRPDHPERRRVARAGRPPRPDRPARPDRPGDLPAVPRADSAIRPARPALAAQSRLRGTRSARWRPTAMWCWTRPPTSASPSAPRAAAT